MDQQNKKKTRSCEQVKTKLQSTNLETQIETERCEEFTQETPSGQEEEKQEDEHCLGRFPLRTDLQLQNRTTPDPTPNTPEPDPQPADISISENSDPKYKSQNPHIKTRITA